MNHCLMPRVLLTKCFFLHRLPNMVCWGTVGGVALVHFTDWRLILDWVPYVNGKFKNDK